MLLSYALFRIGVMFCLLGKVKIIKLHCHVISQQIWLEMFLEDLNFFSYLLYSECMKKRWDGRET
jgi:hypothetical protein